MPTLDELTDSVISELHARTNSQEQLTTLISEIDFDTLTVALEPDSNAAGLGIYEIDDELVYASAGNNTSGFLDVPPWGRGHMSTTATNHAQGTKVIRAPRFPRKVVKGLVNDAIQQTYPDLYGVATTQFVASWVTPQYELPVGCLRVLAVEYQLQSTANREWIGLRRWRLDSQADPALFISGVAISLADLPYPNTAVRVTYAMQPLALVNGYDDFTLTGLRSSVSDLVQLAVVGRMVIGPEVARGQITSAEQSERSTLVQTGSTTSVARYFQALYERRMRAEQQALRALVPVRVVRTWS